TLHSLAKMQLHMGKIDEARNNASEAIRLATAFREVRPHEGNRARLLAIAYYDLAMVQHRSDHVNKSLPNYRAALATTELVREELSERLAGQIYSSYGDALGRTGPLSAAIEALRSSVAIHERRVREHPSNSQTQRDLLTSYMNLGKTLGGTTNPGAGDYQAAS